MLSTEARVRKLQTLLERVHARGSRFAAPASAASPASSVRGAVPRAVAAVPAAAPAIPRPAHVAPPAPAPVAVAPAMTPAPVPVAAKAPTMVVDDAFNTVPPPPDATTQPPTAPSVAPAPVHAGEPRGVLPEPVVTHAHLAASSEVGRFIGELPASASAGDLLAQALLN